MDKGGRPRDPIWADFWCIKEGNKTMSKCKICSHVMGGKTDRMKNHLLKCKKPSVSPGIIEIEALNADTLDIARNQVVEYSTSKDASGTSSHFQGGKEKDDSFAKACKRPRLLQNDLQQFVVQTSSSMKHELDLQIAKFFYSCGIPFNVAEQSEFLTLIQKLRPGYKPPSRKALSGNLLDEVTASLENNMRAALEGKECTLMEDGWSNIHNEPVIASCLHVDGKAYFLNAEECGSNKKTSDYCKEVTERSIELAEEKYKAKVVSVVTDNENKMGKLRQMLLEERSDLIIYGCAAHWMNLLAQDITPASIIKHVVDVQKYFRNHHQPAGWLKETPGAVKPQLPNDTRWNSQTECLSTFIKNRAAYLKICEEHENEIDIRIQRFINDFNLLKQIKDLHQQLQPIAKALNNLQRDEATIADACHEWLELANCWELSPHKNVILRRMDQALKPFHYLAYMTDPKHRNSERLDEKQKEMAREWIVSFMPDAFPFLLAYEAEAKPFPASFIKAKNVEAKIWWKALNSKEICPEFINLMVKIHSIPCSSASIERVFSNFSFIQTKLRNRLGVQKAAKLVFCYRLLRGHMDLDW